MSKTYAVLKQITDQGYRVEFDHVAGCTIMRASHPNKPEDRHVACVENNAQANQDILCARAPAKRVGIVPIEA